MGWFDRIKAITRADIKRRKAPDKLGFRGLRTRLIDEISEEENQFEWVIEGCDAMLYHGLYEAVIKRGTSALLYAQAGLTKGRFYRRPGVECYKAKQSASTWSRDMGLGLIYACFRNNDHTILGQHYQYGKTHAWKMGDGAISRIYYTPQFASLLDQAKFKARGDDYKWYKRVRYSMPKGLDGYQAHLQVLIIAMIGEMYGKIPYRMFQRLKEHSDRKPRNPLFASVYARYGGCNQRAVLACINPIIDDYAGGSEKVVMQKIDRLFAVDYLIR